MMFLSSLAVLALVSSLATGAPNSKKQALPSLRSRVPHDSLNTLPTKVQDGPYGEAILRFNPKLHIASGCQSYPAVNEAGETSGGLDTSGSATGGCNDESKGQTYARSGALGGDKSRTAIMFAWYFPKDQSTDEISPGSHRHDWENFVCWLTADPVEAAGGSYARRLRLGRGVDGGDNSTVPDYETKATVELEIAGGAASGHGEYKIVKGALPGGDSPQLEYFSSYPTNRELQFTNTAGRTLEVLDWDAMTDEMRKGLEDTDFGKANVPFKDANFQNNLQKAAL